MTKPVRALLLCLSILLPVLIGAAASAWLLRHEGAAQGESSACVQYAVDASRVDDEPQAIDLLYQHEEECLGDAEFVQQLRLHLSRTGKPDEARELIGRALEHKTLTPEEARSEQAWSDFEEAQRSDDEQRAASLRDGAQRTAQALIAQWPEWLPSYRLLDELEGGSSDHFWQGMERREAFWSGAWFRSLDLQPAALFAGAAVATGLLGLSMGLYGYAKARQMSRQATTPIARAQPGPVALAGTLELPPGLSMCKTSLKHLDCLWHRYVSRRSSGSHSFGDTSTISIQALLLRDASGTVLLDPREAQVDARHFDWRDSMFHDGESENEHYLLPGDRVYVLGELLAEPGRPGIVRKPGDGGRFLISAYGEQTSRWLARLQLCSGGALFVVCTLLLAWAWQQRYWVKAIPGVLD